MGKLPPQARGWPLLGSALAMLRNTGEFLHAQYTQLGPIYRVRAFHRRFTVLAGPEANLWMMRGGAARLTSKHAFSAIVSELDSPNLVVAADGDRHKHMRRLMRQGYTREAMERKLPMLAEAVEKIVRRFEGQEPIRIRELCQRLIMEQISLTLMGRGATEVFESAAEFSKTVVGAGVGRWPRFYLRLPRYRRAKAAVSAFGESILAERGSCPHAEDQASNLAEIFSNGRDPDGNPLGHAEVKFGVMGAFVAGMDTASSAASFLLWELLRQPELLARVVDEVDQTFNDGVPTAQRLRQMRLLRCAMLETLRLHPIAPTVPRHAAETFEFEGYTVPAGEPLLIATSVTHFLPNLFPDPMRFDIERFQEPRNEDKQAGAYVPFGIGHHVCLATGQAEISIMMAMAVLLRTVRAELDPPGYQVRGEMTPLPAVEAACRVRLREPRHTLAFHAKQVAERAREQMALVLPTLDRHLLVEVAAGVVTRTYAAGAMIVREGDVADRFFMILDGSVEVLASGKTLRTLERGGYFGEIGLLTGAKRSASVRALTEVAVLELDGEGFRKMIDNCDLTSEELARVMRERVVASQLNLALPSLDARMAATLAPEVERRQFAPGDLIVRQGDEAHHFYILLRGECEVTSRGPTGADVVLGALVAGDFFGERGLLLGEPRNATVRARDQVETLELSHAGFRTLVEDAQLAHEEIAHMMRRRAEQPPQ